MTKIYKINGKEMRKIPVNLTEDQARDYGKTDIYWIAEAFNSLLEALSDKEEVKQLTSLKEEIYSKIIDYSYQETTTEETVNEILKLIQSHLVKEVKYKPIGFECDEYNQGYNEGMRDIIKIINNIK